MLDFYNLFSKNKKAPFVKYFLDDDKIKIEFSDGADFSSFILLVNEVTSEELKNNVLSHISDYYQNNGREYESLVSLSLIEEKPIVSPTQY